MTVQPQRPLPCCQLRTCSSTCTCWSMMRSAPELSPSRPGRARHLPAATPSCWPSRWCGTCWAGAARPGSWPRWPATGRTCSRSCRQSEANRRNRWLRGASEQLRAALAARLPEDDGQQIDTSALPVKHASRVRGPDQWTGPGNDLAARFGRDAAHAEWFYGFRLAIKTDLGSRIVRARSIVPAAVSERDVAHDLLEAGPPPRDLLADKGFNGKAFAAQQAARGTAVLVPPTKDQRKRMPAILQKVIAEWRNRVEASFAEITDLMELARHGAHTFWGLLTRTAATIAAHTLLHTCLADLVQA